MCDQSQSGDAGEARASRSRVNLAELHLRATYQFFLGARAADGAHVILAARSCNDMARKAMQNDQIVKLIVGAGQASPSPPVGPALGSKGVKSMDFCKVRQQILSSCSTAILTSLAGVQRKNSELCPRHTDTCQSHCSTRSIIYLRTQDSADRISSAFCGRCYSGQEQAERRWQHSRSKCSDRLRRQRQGILRVRRSW